MRQRALYRAEGETTLTKGGMDRRTVYFNDEEWQAIRRQAFEENRKYTDIVRAMLDW
jgi:hypothetical protein